MGPETPAWLMDAPSFHTLVDALGAALRRPRSAALQSMTFGCDIDRVAQSLREVADAGRATNTELSTAVASMPSAVPDAAYAARLESLIGELSGLWRVRVAMAIRPRRVPVLRALLRAPAPDLLRIIRKDHDENAHSDILRWLLDPETAPTIAPLALRGLMSRLPEADRWRAALDEGLELGCIDVRREVVIGDDLDDRDNRDRIDLVVDGPGFVLGIENKVWAVEHEGQTRSYARWLRSLSKSKFRGARKLTGGLFLSPTGVAPGSAFFQPLSYLELCACLLDASGGSYNPRNTKCWRAT